MNNLEVYKGPMFSGKSTALLKRASKCTEEGISYLLIKPMIDTRYEGHDALKSEMGFVTCHTGERCLALKVKNLSKVDYQNVSYLLVDECQFFDPQDVKDFLDNIPSNQHVVVSGLDLDYLKRPFESMDIVTKVARRVYQLTSTCDICGNDALYTCRTVHSSDRVLLGGAESYSPRCHRCWA